MFTGECFGEILPKSIAIFRHDVPEDWITDMHLGSLGEPVGDLLGGLVEGYEAHVGGDKHNRLVGAIEDGTQVRLGLLQSFIGVFTLGDTADDEQDAGDLACR